MFFDFRRVTSWSRRGMFCILFFVFVFGPFWVAFWSHFGSPNGAKLEQKPSQKIIKKSDYLQERPRWAKGRSWGRLGVVLGCYWASWGRAGGRAWGHLGPFWHTKSSKEKREQSKAAKKQTKRSKEKKQQEREQESSYRKRDCSALPLSVHSSLRFYPHVGALFRSFFLFFFSLRFFELLGAQEGAKMGAFWSQNRIKK